MEDRPGRRVNVVAAGGARPRLATLRRRVPLERRASSHFGQYGVLAVGGVALRHSHSRHVASSGNSRMNSMSEYRDSDDVHASGCCGLHGAMAKFCATIAYTVKG